MDVELYKQVREDANVEVIQINGRSYTSKEIYRVKEPTPETLEVSTLTALVDYIKTNRDANDINTLICHVESPTRVSIYSNLHGDFDQRDKFIRATARINIPAFNTFQDAEKFNIYLQSCFTESPVKDLASGSLVPTDKALLLKYVGNVKQKQVETVGDDGVSQEIVVKSGIASVNAVILPNPVTLRPYRTFNEVEQPASSFVFRARTGPEFALIEADNRAWESEAMQNIKQFMQSEVPELHVIA